MHSDKIPSTLIGLSAVLRSETRRASSRDLADCLLQLGRLIGLALTVEAAGADLQDAKEGLPEALMRALGALTTFGQEWYEEN